MGIYPLKTRISTEEKYLEEIKISANRMVFSA